MEAARDGVTVFQLLCCGRYTVKVPDYQVDGEDLLLPFSHVAPLYFMRRPLTLSRRVGPPGDA